MIPLAGIGRVTEAGGFKVRNMFTEQPTLKLNMLLNINKLNMKKKIIGQTNTVQDQAV